MPDPTLHPTQIVLALRSLEASTGWLIYCERFGEILRSQIEERIFDPKTPEAERAVLVNARRLLVDSYTPDKMVRAMITTAEKQVRSKDDNATARPA